MNQLAHYQQVVEMALQQYSLPQKPENLYESIEYIIGLGGKRLRPVMVLMACDVLNGQVEKATPAALSVELFHNFSLMHDDIMDNADMRRGKASVHQKWNLSTAILGGDALLVKAYQKLLETPGVDKGLLLDLFNTTALEVCEGQQMDMNFEKMETVTVDDYIEMIRLKTAVLMGASFKMGALVANAKKKEQDAMYQFGQDLGIAFQLKDDYLDCFGEAVFGKHVGGDILENKKTYLFIKAKELADSKQLKALKEMVNETDKKMKVQETKKLFVETGAKHETENMMNTYYKKALDALELISVPKDKKQILTQFAESVWKRQK